ncbi:endospore germination permease [Bacillus tianshenii]|nr:endospore germination permease [Bacillus tianshenii]
MNKTANPNQQKNELTTWQFFLIAANYLIGPTYFVQMSGLIGSTKQWAWLPPTLAFLLSLGPIWVWLHLHKKYPGKNFAEISTELLGKKFGALITIIFIYLFVLVAAFSTRNVGDLITTVSMKRTPITVFHFLTLIPAVYMISKGVRTMGRLVEILTPVIFLIFWGSLFLLIGEWNQDRVIPPPDSFNWKAIQTSTLAFFSFPYLQFIAITSILPLARNEAWGRRSILGASAVATISTIAVVFLLIGTIGVTRISHLTYPTIAAAQEIRLFGGTLENLDVFVSSILISTVVIKVAVLLHASLVFIQHILNFPYQIPILMLLTFVTLAFALGVHDNIIENIDIAQKLTPYYSFLLGILLPLLLLVVSLFRKKGGEGQ